MKLLQALIFFSFITILFSQCAEDEELRSNAVVPVSFNLSLGGQSNGRMVSEEAVPDAVYISVRDLTTTRLVYSLKKLELIELGGAYVSENVDLLEGPHTIEDFLVVNDMEEIIYLTPKDGSEFGDFVTDPLNVDFNSIPIDTNTVSLEVIPADLGDPGAYGYTNFTFDIVKTLTVQPNALDGIDAELLSYPDYIDRNFGNNPGFRGVSWTRSRVPGDGRSLIKFNLDSIPTGSEIYKARLYLYGVAVPSNYPGHSKLSGSNAFELLKVTSDWDESTVAWNTQPTTTEDGKIVLPESESIYEDYQIDITHFVQSMVDDRANNFGMMLKLVTESYYRQISFASSDFSDPTKRPKLVVSYK